MKILCYNLLSVRLWSFRYGGQKLAKFNSDKKLKKLSENVNNESNSPNPMFLKNKSFTDLDDLRP